jgi:hypothetical protein
MKKLLVVSTLCLSFFGAIAQNYDNIKNLLIFNKFDQAKTDFDKAMANAKFAGKPEAYILKTTIYAAIAMSEANKDKPSGLQLANEANDAFKKYREMDPDMGLVKDPIYQNGPINLYSAYYSAGYADYTTKSWQPGFEKLKKAVELSDILIAKKISNSPLDTNVLILAGITAESSNNNDDAANYYSRLADAKVGGDGFESVYRFLVSYYFKKKDLANFEKYKTLGSQIYPKSEFFTFDKIDFAAGLATNFNDKVSAVEEILAKDPDNFKANQVLGEILYDTLNSDKEGAVLPANADDLEKRMVELFTKAASVKANYEIPFLYIGDHFINKAAKTNDTRTAHASEMKARTKPGTMASKEDIAKRDMLDKKYGEDLEQARTPYEKAGAILADRAAKEGGLELREKEQYKKVANYLSEIFSYKRIQAKNKPADQAKYQAEEKKWNDIYESINAIKTLKKGHNSAN